MSQKHESRDENHANPRPREGVTAHQYHLKGIKRLLNPRCDDPELVARETEPGEGDYLGRLLHVADEALHAVKSGRPGEPRKRRRTH